MIIKNVYWECMKLTKVTLQDIKNAKETIKDIVKQTDILESAKLSAMTGANVFYKCENLKKQVLLK